VERAEERSCNQGRGPDHVSRTNQELAKGT
jgi:hypothetical protein